MKRVKGKLWFAAKRYGWGWYPVSWQGWVVTLGFVVVSAVDVMMVDRQSHFVSDTLVGFYPRLLIYVLILMAICYWKGEKPRWRWGR